jgi:hypothetical protein
MILKIIRQKILSRVPYSESMVEYDILLMIGKQLRQIAGQVQSNVVVVPQNLRRIWRRLCRTKGMGLIAVRRRHRAFVK